MTKRRDPQPKKSELNIYDLTCTYVPSHRRGNKEIKPHFRTNQQFFSIHSFNLSKSRTVKTGIGKEKTYVFSNNINTENECMKNPPPVPEDIKPLLDLHWGGLNKPPDEFRKFEWNKHWKHHKFDDDVCFWKKAYGVAKMYMPGGDCDLMRIIVEKGYTPGNSYDCEKFVDDLLEGLNHQAWVSFRHAPQGFKYLHQISFLYELDLERHQTARYQTFEKGDTFLFEDFSKNTNQAQEFSFSNDALHWIEVVMLHKILVLTF